MTARDGFRPWAERSAFLVGVVALALVAGSCTSQPRGVPAAEGIANFGRVNGSLFRGAQPDESGLANLARLGVGTVLNLRMPDDVWPAEETSVRRHGMVYVNVPLPGFSSPTDAEVARLLSLIESSPAPVFLHCEHGADRTGTIVACYRMRHDGWTVERALAEAKHYGLSAWEFGMIHYVRGFSAKPGPDAQPGSAAR